MHEVIPQPWVPRYTLELLLVGLVCFNGEGFDELQQLLGAISRAERTNEREKI